MAPLRVMTWNVENLFGVGDADGPATEAALAAKIESLRAAIDAQRPHVLALQEIGREEALQRLQQALTVPMPHRQLGIADERGYPGGVPQPASASRPRRHPSVSGWILADPGRR
jgi:hypothetical protein